MGVKDLKGIVSFILLFFVVLQAKAQIDPIGKDGVAIGGYDVLSYFNFGIPIKGDSKISYVYNNVIYYFISAENKLSFEKEPEKYLPQFDGYCALAMGAQKKKVSINLETFKITNGKLYLFYNGSHALSGNKFNSFESWLKDETNLSKQSEVNWPTLKSARK